MAEKGIWLSTQPLPEELGQAFPKGSPRRLKFEQVLRGIETTYGFAKKYQLKTAFGTDILFSHALAQLQGALLAKLAKWDKPEEALKMATSDNAQLLALSGPRNPYPGKLGVIEEDALADLLLVDGNPLENIKLLADLKNFLIIMKDGRVYKNLL
jgi:imidazolonepropionase-like amidohydrolase